MKPVIEIIDELRSTPHMPDWYSYQPEHPFKPCGIVVWGGDMIHSFRVGAEEQLMGPIPASLFSTVLPLSKLKEHAAAGTLIRFLNQTHLVLPSMSPAIRINMRVTGKPSQVAVFGIQLVKD